MRIQIMREANVAFVHDPIILEGPSHSYLIDWGHKNRNDLAKTYVMQDRQDGGPVLHTFLFPVKKVWLAERR